MADSFLFALDSPQNSQKSQFVYNMFTVIPVCVYNVKHLNTNNYGMF
jgi:hypothetical protein